MNAVVGEERMYKKNNADVLLLEPPNHCAGHRATEITEATAELIRCTVEVKIIEKTNDVQS